MRIYDHCDHLSLYYNKEIRSIPNVVADLPTLNDLNISDIRTFEKREALQRFLKVLEGKDIEVFYSKTYYNCEFINTIDLFRE
jgi:hypothetical protein